MAEGEKAKTAVLVASLPIIVLSLSGISPSSAALCGGCPWWHRLCYQFVHAGLIHAVLNCWVLISAVFMYPTSMWMLLSSYLISASVPASLCPEPTVGLSGMVFALMGRYSFIVARKWYYQKWMLVFLAIGIMIPNVNGWLHLYCYGMGTALSFLSSPRYES